LRGESDKIVVVVGPCSIHDPEEAREYAALLKEEAKNLKNLVIVMRAYFEKVSASIETVRKSIKAFPRGRRRREGSENSKSWRRSTDEEGSLADLESEADTVRLDLSA